MAAFTTGLVIADLWFWNTQRVVSHAILGSIVTLLFFTLCQYEHEYVSIALLLFGIAWALVSYIRIVLTR